jgi:hypothetical protein
VFCERIGLDVNNLDMRLGEGAGPPPKKFDENAPYIFVSYCESDGREFADALVNHLQDQGQRCVYAPQDMQAGRFAGQLTRLVGAAKTFVLLLTPDANHSAHVFQETTKAFNSRTTILPVIIDHTSKGEDLEHLISGTHEVQWTTAPAVAKEVLRLLKKKV